MIYPEINKFCEELCLEGEVWLPVKDWEGLYSVSSFGRVRREPWQEKGYKNPKVLKGHPAAGRYPKVVLSCKIQGGSQSTRSIHRLVAEAFVPNPEGKPQVNHINSNVMDAKSSNLEWTTQSENIQHAFAQGRKIIKKGEESNLAKYKESFIREVYLDIKSSGESQSKVAKRHGLHQTFISGLVTKKIWKHLTDKIDLEVH